jgi:hypothetical protein
MDSFQFPCAHPPATHPRTSSPALDVRYKRLRYFISRSGYTLFYAEDGPRGDGRHDSGFKSQARPALIVAETPVCRQASP